MITINADNKELSVDLSTEEIEKRLEEWTPKPMKYIGVLRKYAKTVGPASEGAVTDRD